MPLLKKEKWERVDRFEEKGGIDVIGYGAPVSSCSGGSGCTLICDVLILHQFCIKHHMWYPLPLSFCNDCFLKTDTATK